jgi:hypothetical protein
MSASRHCRLPAVNRRMTPEAPTYLRQALPVQDNSERESSQVGELPRICSDLSSTTPVGTAELDAIEMYLGALLDALLQ